jgi:hypothetical protein
VKRVYSRGCEVILVGTDCAESRRDTTRFERADVLRMCVKLEPFRQTPQRTEMKLTVSPLVVSQDGYGTAILWVLKSRRCQSSVLLCQSWLHDLLNAVVIVVTHDSN